jgi:uncharacterized protein YlxP (DUF503 family)
MWFAASVKMFKNSLSATCNPMELVCLDLREEVITGKTLSMVYAEVSTFRQKRCVCARLLHDLEAVFVIAVQNARSHECEDRHDISEDCFWGQVSEARDEKESLVEGLGVVRYLK